MSLLLLLIPLAVGLGLIGLAGFFWTLRSGQYDDIDGAAYRILLDDEDEPANAPKEHKPRDPGGRE